MTNHNDPPDTTTVHRVKVAVISPFKIVHGRGDEETILIGFHHEGMCKQYRVSGIHRTLALLSPI